MDIKWVSTKLEDLKEKVVSNIEYHFRALIIDDIGDVGEVDYIVGDMEWYIYWMDRACDIKELLDYIMSEYEREEEHLKLLYESMDLKLIIDKNLRENPNFIEEEVLAYMGAEKESEPQHNYISICREDKQEEIVNQLHNSLSNKGFIKSNQSDFARHFNPYKGILSPIQWFGTEVQIAAIFLNLVRNGIIDRSYEHKIPSTIPIHFKNKKGKEFKDRQLRVPLSKVRSGDVDHLIEDIVELVNSLAEIN